VGDEQLPAGPVMYEKELKQETGDVEIRNLETMQVAG
jgi:hypothetical protein